MTAVVGSTTSRSHGYLLIGTVVATAGLVLLVFALARTHRTAAAPAAVGAYIGAAYSFTSSTSFATIWTRSLIKRPVQARLAW